MSLFGAAPRAGFKEFFNESFWLNEYGDLNYLDGQKISPVLDMAPGANLVPGTPVPPAEAAPGEPEGTLEADSTRSFSPAYESAVSHLDDSADDRGLNVDREASSFDVFYTGRRPHFD